MKRFFAGGLLLASALPAGAEDIKVVGEKEYKGVTISRAEPDGLVIVALTELSKFHLRNRPEMHEEALTPALFPGAFTKNGLDLH